MTSHELSKKKKTFLKEMRKEIKLLENDIKEYEDEQTKILLLRNWHIFLLNLKRIYPYLIFSSITFCISNEIIEKNETYLKKIVDSYGNIKCENYVTKDKHNTVLKYDNCTLKDGFYTRDILVYDTYEYTEKELKYLVKNNELNIDTLGNPTNKHTLKTKKEPKHTDSYIECIIYELDKPEKSYKYIIIEIIANLLGFSVIAYYREKYSDFSYEKSLKLINKEYPNNENIEELKKILEIRKSNYKMIRGKNNGKDN